MPTDNPERELSKIEAEAALYRAHRPGVLLNKTARAEGPGAPGCWLGGEPTLPPDIEWPWFRHQHYAVEAPRLLLAQLNLAAMPRFARYPEMPETGTLFFFYNILFDHWDPEPGRVIYVEEDVSKYPARPLPDYEVTDDTPLNPNHNYKYKPFTNFRKWCFDFIVFDGLSNFQNFSLSPAYEGEVDLDFVKQLKAITKSRRSSQDSDHYFAGHHSLASFGRLTHPHPRDGGVTYRDPLDPDASQRDDFIRLLAILDDDHLGIDYGTFVWTVFMITPENLKARAFDEAFTVWENN